MDVQFNPNMNAYVGQNAQPVKFGGLTPGGSFKGGEKIGGGKPTAAGEIAQVGDIGASKRQGYLNGLGGTNHPCDANGRPCSLVLTA